MSTRSGYSRASVRALVLLVENLSDDLLDRSSIVTHPAVPPYSSSTSREMLLQALEVRQPSSTSREPGTTWMGRMIARMSNGDPGLRRMGSDPSPARADDVCRSSRSTRDSASDASLPRARASRPVASMESASMSVRVIITSRAFFSENSNTPSSSVAGAGSSTPPLRSAPREC